MKFIVSVPQQEADSVSFFLQNDKTTSKIDGGTRTQNGEETTTKGYQVEPMPKEKIQIGKYEINFNLKYYKLV